MTSDNLAALTASEAARAVAGGEVSAVELAQAALRHIEATEGQVRAFTHFDSAHVIAQAQQRDAHRQQGGALGPLHGVPVAVKDIFDTADFPTESGSPILKGRRPMADSTPVARLRAAGAVILGKTVTTEFAYYHPGPTANPRNLAHTPGGSSSGSAAAVAAGMAPLALGSQTNGSMIRPGAYCGVFAIKPSHGLISRAGVLSLSRTLDHVGVFARALDDIALALEVLAGYDAADPDTRPVAAPDFRATLASAHPLPPDFAFVKTAAWPKATADTRAAFDAVCARLGERVKAVDLAESYAQAWEDQRTVMSVEMAHNLGALADKGGDLASPVFRKLVADGRAMTGPQYLRAVENGRRYRAGISELFTTYDAIITPAAPGIAPKGLDATGDPGFCSMWTLTGLPAVTLPLLSGEGGMPIGLQLIGPPNSDARLLRTARWLVENL